VTRSLVAATAVLGAAAVVAVPTALSAGGADLVVLYTIDTGTALATCG
jgi:hypothetical protein